MARRQHQDLCAPVYQRMGLIKSASVFFCSRLAKAVSISRLVLAPRISICPPDGGSCRLQIRDDGASTGVRAANERGRLINDVLDLSKIEAGQLTLSLSNYSIENVIQTVFSAVEPLAAEKQIALKGLPQGRGDEQRLIPFPYRYDLAM